MPMDNIIEKLHPLEIKLLPYLHNGITFSELIEKSGMKDIEIMRVLQWLSNKEAVKLTEEKAEIILLDENGKKYIKEGLPEKRLLAFLKLNPASMDEIFQKSGLDKAEVNMSLGLLKGKVAIEFSPDKKIKITANGEKLLATQSLEEKFLHRTFPCVKETLLPEEKFAFDSLMKRRQIIRTDVDKKITVEVTASGKKLISDAKGISLEIEDHLTSEMLKSGSWKSKKFRHYDITINVPSITGGKRHFVRQSIDYIKKVWLELGFKEMEGNLIQSAFWDLDALFVPQDHPARNMQDSFYIKDPANAKLPAIKKKIKDVHETGADTGSKGWGGKWSEEEASKNMLRTHTTVLSARTIASLKKEDLPAKFFSVNKVFRNEVLSWKHLFEFHQVEGIVIDPNATLKHLKGYLSEFYKKLGFEKVRMRPAHFPYTEPSLEVEVFHPIKKEWVELGGAGIFRPEVVKSLLGIDVPVLAWGQGLERGIMDFYKFKDIRMLYNNNLKEIKEVKIWRQ